MSPARYLDPSWIATYRPFTPLTARQTRKSDQKRLFWRSTFGYLSPFSRLFAPLELHYLKTHTLAFGSFKTRLIDTEDFDSVYWILGRECETLSSPLPPLWPSREASLVFEDIQPLAKPRTPGPIRLLLCNLKGSETEAQPPFPNLLLVLPTPSWLPPFTKPHAPGQDRFGKNSSLRMILKLWRLQIGRWRGVSRKQGRIGG